MMVKVWLKWHNRWGSEEDSNDITGDKTMPEVGGRVFPYTKKGIEDARTYAKRTGKKLVMNERATRKNPKRNYK